VSGITIDVSEIKQLEKLFGTAAKASSVGAEKALRDVTVKVAGEAVANALSFHTASTGELAAAVEHQVSGTGARVFADVRQAFFLEYGSPTTGGPRPWLTEPAERGSTELLTRLSKLGMEALER